MSQEGKSLQPPGDGIEGQLNIKQELIKRESRRKFKTILVYFLEEYFSHSEGQDFGNWAAKLGYYLFHQQNHQFWFNSFFLKSR